MAVPGKETREVARSTEVVQGASPGTQTQRPQPGCLCMSRCDLTLSSGGLHCGGPAELL